MADDTKGAGKDVIQQSESVQKLYELVDLKGGGTLVQSFRRAQARKDYSEFDDILNCQIKLLLYEGGEGKEVPISKLVLWRKESRQSQDKFASSKSKACPACCARGSNAVDSLVGTGGYAMAELQGKTYSSTLF